MVGGGAWRRVCSVAAGASAHGWRRHAGGGAGSGAGLARPALPGAGWAGARRDSGRCRAVSGGATGFVERRPWEGTDSDAVLDGIRAEAPTAIPVPSTAGTPLDACATTRERTPAGHR